MKVLMVTDLYLPCIGGLERSVADVSAELAERGHDVVVATLWHEGLPREEQDGAVRVYRLEGLAQRLPFLFTRPDQRFHPPMPDAILVAQLRSLIARERPDVVHGHSWMMLSALAWPRAHSYATVVTLHDYALLCPKKTLLLDEERACHRHTGPRCLPCAAAHYGRAKGLLATAGLAVGRRWYRDVDLLIAISSCVAAAHARDPAMAEVPMVTIPSFVRDSLLSALPGRPLAGLPRDYILFAGALGRHKGIHVLLDAYARLGASVPLVLIGAPRPETPRLFPPNVIVLPPLPHGDVIRAIDHCRFLVCPGLWPEPLGLSCIEATARGKAVVSSRAGGSLDIVEDGRTGLLTPPGDAPALAAAMQTLLDHPAAATKMGRAGAARCAGHFSASTTVPRLLEAYGGARDRAHQRGKVRQ